MCIKDEDSSSQQQPLLHQAEERVRGDSSNRTSREDPQYHHHQRSNTFPGAFSLSDEERVHSMITHRAADNGASGMIVSSSNSLSDNEHRPRLKKDSGNSSNSQDDEHDGNDNCSDKAQDNSEHSECSSQSNEENEDCEDNKHKHNKENKADKNYKPESLKRKVIRRTLFAICVLIGQTFLSAYLKAYGIISKDFNDIVAERLAPVAEQVMPELSQRLELLEMRMRDAVESARFMAPGFNETLYWLRLNQTASQGTMKTQARLRPGHQLVEQYGVRGQYPVVMVPGFVTSGLEVWKGKTCMDNFFRERVWGGLSSAQFWLRERYCVMENLALNPVTGGDPEGIKLRSAEGFHAADFFVGNDWMWGNYWVWSKIFENLADVGYDGGSMSMEAYDWRLANQILEERDGYFTHLKSKIEAYHKTRGKKVVLTSHSMGAIVVHYFFAWVTKKSNRGGGGGGKDWVDKHIHAYVNIAGSQLGVVKAASALLSGEMSDTVFMGGIGHVVEHFIPRKARKDLWNSWGSLWTMLPKGGDALWSIGADLPNTTDTAEDSDSPKSNYSQALNKYMFIMSDVDQDNVDEDLKKYPICNREELIDPSTESEVNEALREFASRANHTAQQTIDFLLKWGGGMGPTISPIKLHSFKYDHREKPSPRTWHDVTQTPLPHAPNMKIYCLYGVGIDTERAYVYKRNPGEQRSFMEDNKSEDGTIPVIDPPFQLDTKVDDEENNVEHGIKYADGDGSVPLLSLGYMCAGPWRNKKSGLNPSGSKVIIREYEHKAEFTVDDPMRKGPRSAEHVDVLGHIEMMEDLMRIVTDHEIDDMKDKIISDIENIVKRIDEHPNGGLKRPKRR